MSAIPSIRHGSRVERGPAREAEAARALYERYASQVFRYCLRQLGGREEAEDAVQSTFLNVFRGLKRGVVPESESAWLFTIARNVCLSRRRSSWRRGRIESPADFDVVEETTPAPARGEDELIGLQDALERMPETQRRAILLREWRGLSYREIAEELELSQAAVETLVFRARRTLAHGLEQPQQPPRRRVSRAADLGNVVAAIESLLVGGGATAKVAATVAVVSATTVVAAPPVERHLHRHHGRPAGSPQPRWSTTAPTDGAPAASSTPQATTAAREPTRRVQRSAADGAAETRGAPAPSAALGEPLVAGGEAVADPAAAATASAASSPPATSSAPTPPATAPEPAVPARPAAAAPESGEHPEPSPQQFSGAAAVAPTVDSSAPGRKGRDAGGDAGQERSWGRDASPPVGLPRELRHAARERDAGHAERGGTSGVPASSQTLSVQTPSTPTQASPPPAPPSSTPSPPAGASGGQPQGAGGDHGRWDDHGSRPGGHDWKRGGGR
ncbi:MAG: sigma-70 family RNA polymerase sigma factor [Thermoleophilia bacterium]|nr:sigma-70 family RNA polymerase sigma factor [Thermoleophilia bacterium]